MTEETKKIVSKQSAQSDRSRNSEIFEIGCRAGLEMKKSTGVQKETNNEDKHGLNHADKKKSELEQKIRYQVACEERAFHFVEKLLDNPISESFLLHAVKYMSPNHYEDVTEERAISFQCGYPICSNSINKPLKQKYHISSKSNKVYDITKRKNYCTNICYKASEHLLSQILESPLWTRDEEDTHVIALLAKENNKGSIGEEIIFNSETAVERQSSKATLVDKSHTNNAKKTTVHKDTRMGTVDSGAKQQHKVDLSADHKTESSGKQYASIEDDFSILEATESSMSSPEMPSSLTSQGNCGQLMKTTDVSQKANIHTRLDNVSSSKQEDSDTLVSVHCDSRVMKVSSLEIQKNIQKLVHTQDSDEDDSDDEKKVELGPKSIGKVKEQETCPTESTSGSNVTPIPDLSPIELVHNCLREWKTFDTVKFIQGGTDENGELHSKVSQSEYEVRYAELSQKLKQNSLEDMDSILEEEKLTSVHGSREGLTNIGQLKEATALFDLQVKEYYQGGTRLPSAFVKKSHSRSNDGQEEGKQPILPMIDSYEQMALRRKIFLRQLERVYPNLLEPLHLSLADITSDLRNLVQSFRFSNKNIIFKPAEWTMVAVVLLYVIALQKPKLKEYLEQDFQYKYLETILSSWEISPVNIYTIVSKILAES